MKDSSKDLAPMPVKTIQNKCFDVQYKCEDTVTNHNK